MTLFLEDFKEPSNFLGAGAGPPWPPRIYGPASSSYVQRQTSNRGLYEWTDCVAWQVMGTGSFLVYYSFAILSVTVPIMSSTVWTTGTDRIK